MEPRNPLKKKKKTTELKDWDRLGATSLHITRSVVLEAPPGEERVLDANASRARPCRVVTVTHNATLTLRGITLTGGATWYDPDDGWQGRISWTGAGAYIQYGASLVLINSRVVRNVVASTLPGQSRSSIPSPLASRSHPAAAAAHHSVPLV